MRLLISALTATVLLGGTASMAQAVPTSSGPRIKPPVASSFSPTRIKPPIAPTSTAPTSTQLTACAAALTTVSTLRPFGSC